MKACACLLAIPLFFPQLRADVTLQFRSDFKAAPSLPPQMTESLHRTVPALSLRLKNGKSYSVSGPNISICDYAKQELTLINPENKTYTTLKAADLAPRVTALLPRMPDPVRNAMQSLKTGFEIKNTGKTDVVEGVQVEDTEVDLSMAMPLPDGRLSPGANTVMHIWRPKAEETLRVQAIRELAGYSLYANTYMNPIASIQRMISALPGFSDSFNKAFEELAASTLPVLRMTIEVYIPFLVQMAQKDSSQTSIIDPAAPLISLTSEAVELSSTPLDDALFQVPAGYTPVPADDLLRATFAAGMQK